MAVTSAAKAPRQSMDFGIIDTTPSHGFKVACIHSTTTQTQHACFVCGEPRSASALRAAHDPSQHVTHFAQDWIQLVLNFGQPRATARRDHPLYLLSAGAR